MAAVGVVPGDPVPRAAQVEAARHRRCMRAPGLRLDDHLRNPFIQPLERPGGILGVDEHAVDARPLRAVVVDPGDRAAGRPLEAVGRSPQRRPAVEPLVEVADAAVLDDAGRGLGRHVDRPGLHRRIDDQLHARLSATKRSSMKSASRADIGYFGIRWLLGVCRRWARQFLDRHQTHHGRRLQPTASCHLCRFHRVPHSGPPGPGGALSDALRPDQLHPPEPGGPRSSDPSHPPASPAGHAGRSSHRPKSRSTSNGGSFQGADSRQVNILKM